MRLHSLLHSLLVSLSFFFPACTTDESDLDLMAVETPWLSGPTSWEYVGQSRLHSFARAWDARWVALRNSSTGKQIVVRVLQPAGGPAGQWSSQLALEKARHALWAVRQSFPGARALSSVRVVFNGPLATQAPALGAGVAGGQGAGSVVIAGITYVVIPVVAAVAITTAIDRAMNDNFIWTEVNNGGGVGVVLGYVPPGNVAGAEGKTTVNCFAQDREQACRSAIGTTVTDYSSWFLGSPWTCSDVYADGTGRTTGDPNWDTAVLRCDLLVQSCEAMTSAVCD